MKKPVFSLLFIVLVQLVVFAQGVKKDGVTVELSKPFPVVDAVDKLYLSNDEYLVALKITKKGTVNIQSFDVKSLNLISVNVYKDLLEEASFEFFQEAKGRFYLYYSLYDKVNKLEQLFVREIDPKSAKFIGEERKIITVEDKITGTLIANGMFYSFKTVNKFSFDDSYDGDKLLIYYKLKPQIKNDSKNFDVVGIHVFDEKVNQLWSKVFEFPYTEKKMDLLDYAVNAKGDVFILSKIYNDDTENQRNKSDKPNYHMAVFIIDNNTKKLSETKIELGDKYINSIILNDLNEDFMSMGGYYRNPESTYGSDGVFVFKLKSDGVLYDKSYHDIPLGILNQNASKKEIKKNSKKEESTGNASFENLKLDRIVTQPDGSTILIGEERYSITTTYRDANGNWHTSTTYYYNDILVTKISAKGELIWMHKLPKFQRGGRTLGGMSFQYMKNNTDHFFFFLDNIKNEALEKDEAPAGHVDGAGGVLMSTKINNGSGRSTKESLFNLRDVNGIEVFQFDTDRVVQISDHEIAVEVYKKKKEDIWIRVKLN